MKRSTISLPRSSPLPQDEGLYLPGGSNIYITRTRSGKPAFARKKKPDLLQDFGFDILGQSFGIRSLPDTGRRSRSQPRFPHGPPDLVPTVASAQYIPEKATFNYDELESGESGSDSEEVTLVVKKKRGDNSSPETTLRGILKHPGRRGSFGVRSTPATPGRRSSMSYPYSFPGFQPSAPPPPYQYPQSGTGQVPPFPLGQPYHSYQGPSQVPSGPPPVAVNGPPMWMPQQAQVPPHYANPAAYAAPQQMPMPVQLGQQQHAVPRFPHPTTPAPFIPTQPPPPASFPTLPIFQGSGPAAARGNQHGTNNGTGNANSRRHDSGIERDQSVIRRESERQARGNPDGDTNDIEGIGKRIRHYHICAGCGKRRSREYQKRHPLRRGERPTPAYCTRCIRDANYSDTTLSEASAAERDATSGVGAPVRNYGFSFC